ncbi:MAG: M12 family metallo-peptidase [Bacteroidota bacterium]
MRKVYQLLFGLMAIAPLNILAQKQFIATPVNPNAAESLTRVFKSYALFTINTGSLADFVQSNGKGFSDFELTLEGYASFPFSIYQQDIMSGDYQLIVAGPQGRQVFPKPACMTYTGKLSNDEASSVALTITPGFFYGMMRGNNKEYFIEPLKNFDRQASADLFVVYETKDVIPHTGKICGATEVAGKQQQQPAITGTDAVTGSATGTCKMTEMAIASDDSMAMKYGTAAEVQQHNISVMNIVNTIYGNAQLGGAQYLQFTVKGQYVSTSAATNPILPAYAGRDADIILDNFANWGNANNFGFTFDLGQLWTGRNIESVYINGTDTTRYPSVIGLANIAATCKSSRYQLIEDAVTGYQRGVLVAHETGHNFDAQHDGSGALYIMAPAINDATSFSPASINSITSYLQSGQASCLAVCTGIAPVADFDMSASGLCGPGSITFTNTSGGTVTGINWSFPEGNPTTSTASNPVVSFATTGFKTATLTVSNGSGSSNYTKKVFIGSTPLPGCRTNVAGNGLFATFFSFKLAAINWSINTFYPGQTIYNDLSCQHNTVLLPGTSYTGTARVGLLQDSYNITDKMDLYIDYNSDGDFLDAGENVFTTGTCAQGNLTFGFTTPAIPPVTNSWLRMRAISLPCGTSSNGCTTPANSQIYDFAVVFPTTNCITYVNAAAVGANNGTSWANAYTTMSSALTAAAPCSSSEIWVAAGTYKPTAGTDRSLSFAMKSGRRILGGFPNTGSPTIAQRQPASFITTLSGDIGLAGNADNSYHVISNGGGLGNTAILDGFVITGGNANGTGAFQKRGGGVFNNGANAGIVCSPVFENCSFINNVADSGGAIFNNGSNGGTSSPVFINCIFQNNTAPNSGGAVYNNGGSGGTSSPTFTNCIFQNNTATARGGAAVNDGRTSGISSPTYMNCSFFNNSSIQGSAFYSIGSSGACFPSITNNIFYGNNGAGTFVNFSATVTARYNLFEPLVTGYTNTIGNITSSVSPFVTPTNLHLKDFSTAIDGGTTTGAPLRDIENTTRTLYPDMGAYENLQSCIGADKIYYSDSVGSAYQWQVFNGTSFVNVSNGPAYANVSTNKFTVIAPADTTTGTRFRCAVTTPGGTIYSSEIILRFYNRWLGNVNNNWTSSANWSCGVIPNQYTDVILPSAKTIYPLNNVTGTIRKLLAENGSSITVKTGSNLIVTGED